MLLAVMSPWTVKVSSINCKKWPPPLLPIKVAEPVIWPPDLNTKPLALISVSSTVNPPIEADLNVAKPCESILELALDIVDGEPPILDGVLMEFAVISPCTVSELPTNCRNWPAPLSPIKVVEPVIWPSLLSTNPLELISVGDMTNPPIEADLNVAKPPALILELAFWSVDGEPPMLAGVLILSAVILPCTVKVSSTNCKNCPALLSPNNIAEAVTVPCGVKW